MTAVTEIDGRAAQLFRDRFGQSPESVGVAPGRINIVGEHTDYNQGFVLPSAIDRRVGVALRRRDDSRIVLRSDRFPTPVTLRSLPAQRQGIWADYLLGVANELTQRSGPSSGFEAAIVSEIPVGSGLSSSGAVEVAMAVALLNAYGTRMASLAIAQLCQRAENGFVGARTGIMDQMTALQARAGHAMLLDCRSLAHQNVPMPDARLRWLLADTRVHHALASSAYNDRRAQCEAAARSLRVASLRDAKETDLEQLHDPLLLRRARHVVTENARVLRAAEVLNAGLPSDLGPILFASHMSLRDDFEVSCAELDCLVDLAQGLPHVIGARMMGGGFGGCVLVLLEASATEDVEDQLTEGYRHRFHQAPMFYPVRSVDGAMPDGA